VGEVKGGKRMGLLRVTKKKQATKKKNSSSDFVAQATLRRPPDSALPRASATTC
jgi:hypothetical protein